MRAFVVCSFRLRPHYSGSGFGFRPMPAMGKVRLSFLKRRTLPGDLMGIHVAIVHARTYPVLCSCFSVSKTYFDRFV